MWDESDDDDVDNEEFKDENVFDNSVIGSAQKEYPPAFEQVDQSLGLSQFMLPSNRGGSGVAEVEANNIIKLELEQKTQQVSDLQVQIEEKDAILMQRSVVVNEYKQTQFA